MISLAPTGSNILVHKVGVDEQTSLGGLIIPDHVRAGVGVRNLYKVLKCGPDISNAFVGVTFFAPNGIMGSQVDQDTYLCAFDTDIFRAYVEDEQSERALKELTQLEDSDTWSLE